MDNGKAESGAGDTLACAVDLRGGHKVCCELLMGARKVSRTAVYVVVKWFSCGIGAQLRLVDVVLRERSECDTSASS